MRKRILKISATLYFPLLVLTIIWGYLQEQSLITNMARIQQRNIQSKSYHLADQCETLIDITSYWSTVSLPASFAQKSQLPSDFIDNYIRIVQGFETYEQFRLLDLHGNEVVRYVRVDKNTMKPGELQSKVDRSYFQKGLMLKKGQVYISPIELNKEYGIIEYPYKPVIRGVTPVFDVNDDQVGLAVINFNMTEIFDHMKTRLAEDNFYLVDKNRNVITTNLSGNTLPHQSGMSKTDSIVQKKLELSKLIFEKDTFFLEKGSLWVYQNVRIGFEKDIGMNRYTDMAEMVSDNDWAIIQEIPPSEMGKVLGSNERNILVFNAFILGMIILAALGYEHTQRERQSLIAELKKKNLALLNSQAQLESTNQLVKRSNEKLHMRNQQLEDFNYVVAHNLKAPVSSMSIIVDMLSKSENQETFNELLPKLQTISTNISTLTEDVQTYISILNNRDLRMENLNLFLMLKEVEANFTEKLLDKKTKNLEIIYKLDAWHSLNASRFYMKSILQNFLSNAFKYRRPDVDSYILFESGWENNQKVLYIRDNGLGIDLERHGDNLFKLYNRFHRHISGKGMGLFIIKSQLEAMNATINVESEENVGTTFIIKFNK
ncbi:sensor histidine kinase [Flagellimonas crocea]|uniref:sensor histidine kinase n=1 Tax=Flagellimonas crocea TaxID=3067311 RepID=UPI00296E7CB3|nr:sensor histidine kinase [Muricauda sp. DH64]